MCTTRGRRNKSWGFRRSSGDNPGDSEFPLDLGFLVRDSVSRTGQRTPTGTGRPSRQTNTFGVIGGRRRVRSTRRERARTEREATRSGYRVAGKPVATGTGFTGPRSAEHPNCSGGGGSAASQRRHGRPGQRERRREATEPACRQTGLRLRQRGPVRRASGSGRHRRRETGGKARVQRGRVADRPGAHLRNGDRFAGRGHGEAAGIGRPVHGVERQRVRATEPTAENGHRPPSLRARRAM